MTEKEIERIHLWCESKLGYVPTEEEWVKVNNEEPGLVRLYMHVFNRNMMNRNIDKELYTYEKKPSALDIAADIELGKVWNGKD